MTAFWRNWLTVWCWGVAVFGVVLAGAGFVATGGPAQFLMNIMNGTGQPIILDAPLRFVVGLMGALTIGLAMLVAAGVRAADELGPHGRPIWVMVTWAMAVWYVVDSSISCANGFTLNALSNTLLMAGFLLPIIASGAFKESAPAH